MGLEATMIVIDNSEYMRNEDFAPSRYDSQKTAMEYIFQSKVNANPENTVGLLSYGGNGPQVLSTLTNNFGKILSGAKEVKIDGTNHFSSGIQVAALALKHRQNKLQNQRIIIFVGSPIEENEKDLEKLAKKMKKNNIAIDIVNFGEDNINSSKLEKFQSIINNHDNSHLLSVPAGPRLLYEVVAGSSILVEEGFEIPTGVGSGGDFGDFGGSGDLIDPNMDPDLALALRLSLEEEKARQERESKEKEKEQEKEKESTNGTLEKIDENDENDDKDKDKDVTMEDATK